MLAGILFVLKIIGYILLGILALFLLLLLLVLFVPVRYRFNFSSEEPLEDAESSVDIKVQVRIKYLFPALWIKMIYENNSFQMILRIFGIRLKQKVQENGSDTTNDIADTSLVVSDEKSKKETLSDTVEDEKQSDTAAETKLLETDVADNNKEIDSDERNCNDSSETADSDTTTQKNKKRKSKDNSSKSSIKEKLEDFKNKKDWLKRQITDKAHQAAVIHVLKELSYLLKHYAPRKLKADAQFGFADPATTGYVTGILSVIPVMYHKDCNITPDFVTDKNYIYGSLQGKGHIRGWHVVAVLGRLLMDRNMRRLLRVIRNK